MTGNRMCSISRGMNLLTCEHDPLITISATAEALGFAAPVPQEQVLPSVEEYAQTLSDAEREVFLSRLIQQTALNNVYRLNELLVAAAIEPTTSTRTKLDVLDANIKLSGLAAKQAAKEQLGAGFSINITIPNAPTPTQTVTIEGTATKLHDSDDE